MGPLGRSNSTFLYTQGSGYTLTMTRGSGCNPQVICQTVERIVPGATLKNESSGQLIINLPDSEVEHFPMLFETLGEAKKELGILNFGLSVTTMEDVFLR